MESPSKALSPQSANFFDLPAEVRDMIYLYFRPFSWIDITQMPDKIHQPSISRVSRRVRKESLDIFYGKNRFMLDMRGWKSAAWPKDWNPNNIFHNWVDAIGDENAARLRQLSFYLHGFAAHFSIHLDAGKPRITSRCRQTRSISAYDDIAEDAPANYTYRIAVQRAEGRIAHVIAHMTAEIGHGSLAGRHIHQLADLVEAVKPTLCTRAGVGWKGAVLDPDVTIEPDVSQHLTNCYECGYHRLAKRNP